MNKLVAPFPKEFKQDGYIHWKVIDLSNRTYDGIIGQNVLNKLKAKINLEKKYIEINKNKIKFIDSDYPYEIEKVFSIEPIEDPILEKFNLSHLNEEEKYEIKKIIMEYQDLFFKENDKLTATNEVQHEIITTTDQQINAKTYRFPQIHEEEVNRQLKEMEEQNIIQKSNSKYNSPLWIVPKKIDNSGKRKWRIVIDYRKLNEITIDDKFPLPNIDGILDKLGKAQYFTTLDLAKGFHQILIRPEDRKKTAFQTPLGFYEFVRMPFGLKNAPATFQRLMNSVLREFINKICVVYLDDILIFSTTLKEHLESIRKIFNRLREKQLKIQIDKCNFMKKETEFLGHILTPDGIKPNPNKIKVIKELKLPTTQKQIKSFLGITGYYRKFIKDYAKVAQPLTKYLKKDSKININDPNYINAYEKLKDMITSHPILRYPNFDKNFTLTTDASNFAIGAVLSQEGHPICYASRTLNNHERNYSTTDKELLAIVWATNYFRPYLYGREFDIYTDHQPLKYLYAKYKGQDFSSKHQRWLLKLGEYKIRMEYIKGKENRAADFLSRINTDKNEINYISGKLADLINEKSIENRIEINELFDTNANDVESIEMQTIHSTEEDLNDHIPILETIVNRFKTQIILVQSKDKEFEKIFSNRRIFIDQNDLQNNLIDILRRYISKGKVAIYSELPDNQYNILQQKIRELYSNDATLKFVKCSYFATDYEDEEKCLKQISLYHSKESGHSGIIENYESLKNKIYRPNLKILVNKVINNCDTCTAGKYDRNPIKKKFVLTETPSDINEIVHMDIYVNQKHSFLNLIDKFSKHAVSLYLEDRNNQTIIEKIKLFISMKGKMKKLVCDNEFKSINIKDFCRNEGIEIHYVKPNNHTGNSDVERLNNTLSEKIRTLNIENKLPIKEQIMKAIEYYNKNYHSTIKASPLEVQEGRVDKNKIYNRILKTKTVSIKKANKNRESYEEKRNEGFIKNYASLRHKEKPKFRKYKLKGVHENNIKRPLKFSDEAMAMDNDTDNNGSIESTNNDS